MLYRGESPGSVTSPVLDVVVPVPERKLKDQFLFYRVPTYVLLMQSQRTMAQTMIKGWHGIPEHEDGKNSSKQDSDKWEKN
ncbi:hypothetical protein RRG08_011524 [Elysia crispata]|uniref:Uncharacterized protein n=1 Tax=Elysia crispata TaxID=231223 RepID=A0AAE1E333_9GAST|nr:hypothetical protein RRG08_011524 [Elysia crispata]